MEELNALWYDTEGTWDAVHAQAKDLDDLINAFQRGHRSLAERRCKTPQGGRPPCQGRECSQAEALRSDMIAVGGYLCLPPGRGL